MIPSSISSQVTSRAKLSPLLSKGLPFDATLCATDESVTPGRPAQRTSECRFFHLLSKRFKVPSDLAAGLPHRATGIRRRISPWSRGDNDKGKLELSNSRQALEPAVLYMTTDNERPVATIHPDMSKINFLDANLAKTCLYT